MRKIKRLLLLLSIILNAIGNAAPISPSSTALLLSLGYTAVPVRFVANGFSADSGTALVDAAVDGKAFYPFIIDTGSTVTTIDIHTARGNQFKYQNKTSTLGGEDSQRHPADQVLLSLLEFNSFTAKDILAYTENDTFVKLDKKPIAGKLGLDFLKKYHAILDVPGKRLYLKLPTDNLQELKNSTTYQRSFFQAGLKKINLGYSPTGHALIAAQINNHTPVNFLFDSGVPNTILSLAYTKKLGLELQNFSKTGRGSGGGEMKFFKTHVNKISVNSINWLSRTIMVTDLKYAIVDTPLFGVIGFDWMQDKKAIIDFANQSVFVH